MNRRARLFALLALSVLVVSVPGTAAGSGAIVLEQELVATERSGELEVVLRFEIPEPVTRLWTRLPAGAVVTDADGFERAGGEGSDEYEWRGGDRSPTLTYAVETDRTYGKGGLMFTDAGEWALVERPRTSVRWRWVGQRVTLERTTRVDSGVAGDRMAFLGEYEVDTREAGRETVTLVVPAAASPVESPDAVHAALADATELRVGGRNDELFVVVAPSDERWGLRGLQFGSSDAWVREDSRLDDPDNVWIHEYVHSRQTFETDREVRWFKEGSAAYYAALLTYERGDVAFEEFRERLARGERSPHADDVLADPATWTHGPDYHKRALVAADLDRRIRLATGGERDLQDVFRAMNEHEGRITQSAFLAIVEETGGQEVREVTRAHTETREGPTTWDQRTHREAFDLTAPRVEHRLADDAATYRVSGPYRDRALDGEELVLVPGERLETTATVENVGDAPGEYAATVTVEKRGDAGGRARSDDDGGVRTVERRLDPGEREEIGVARTFDEPGVYTLSVGEASTRVRVVEPAEPTVTALEPDATTVVPGGTVTLVATVENDAAVPGRADLELAGEGVETSETVRLDAGASETVEFAASLETPGDHELRVGGESTTVRVERTVVSTQPGLDATGAIAAVILLALFSAASPRGRGRR